MGNTDTGMELLMEEELELFFNDKMQLAAEFADQITRNASLYSKEAFETMVLSQEDIAGLIGRIHWRISRTFGLEEGPARFEGFASAEIERYHRVLGGLAGRCKTSRHIAAVAENIIDDSFSYMLGRSCSSNLVDIAAGNMKLGRRLLGENSNKAQLEKFRQDFLKHIKGMLINTKVRIKNEMLREWEYWDEENDLVAIPV